MEQVENDFKDPEDGFWDKNNSEGVVSNSEVPVNLDIRGQRRFCHVQFVTKIHLIASSSFGISFIRSLICVELSKSKM